ncbi:MAG: outer membrane lipoprotein carrier protein LolA [Bacteroidia bacterium]|nr:outer membrane lipoprotein carrier protein LolA [Bacteroidia bacterium]
MNKPILFSFLIISFLGLSFIQTPKKETEKDKATTKLLKDVSKKYKAYKTLKADFTVLQEPADAKAAKKTDKGNLITKGNSFKLIYSGQEIFCNGKFLWTYTKDLNECQKEDYAPNAVSSINPAKIFTIWEKGFLYASDGTYKKGTSTISKIKLTPTDKTKSYFLMNLEVDQSSKTVQSLKVSFKAGNKQTYTVTSQTPNTVVADNVFEFDATKYPGVEIIDFTKKKKKP